MEGGDTMTYGIRVRDGQAVGTVEGNLSKIKPLEGEDMETFEDREAFASRLGELTPERDDGPTTAERLAALEARMDKAAEGKADEAVQRADLRGNAP